MRWKWSVLIAAVLLPGCGPAVPETGDVSGNVTIDGKPASGIRVRFTPTGPGRASTGTTDEDGNYSLIYSANATGALIGKHTVTIASEEPSVEAPKSGEKMITPTTVPKKYAEATKEVEVSAGDNTIDLNYP